MNTAVIILAAGSASRMNQPKMLLPFRSSNILSQLLSEVKVIEPDHICLVTGFYHQLIIDNIDKKNLDIVYNENWKDGMASSIKKGLSELLNKNDKLTAVYIVVSDQPYLNSGILQKMKLMQVENKKGIIAAKYNEVIGTPVLFQKKYFKELMNLKGNTGAKSILIQHPEDTATVDFILGAIDIDTAEDYEKLSLQNNEPNA